MPSRKDRGRYAVLACFLLPVGITACSDGNDAGTGPGDLTPPTVVTVAPASGATGVDVAAVLVITFSEPVDAESVGAATVSLAPETERTAGVEGTPAVHDQQIVFTPSAPLDYATTYRAEVGSGVTDLAGNALAGPYAWTFTTGDPPRPLLDLRLEQGNRWMYFGESSATVVSQYGSSSEFSQDLRVLHIDSPVSYAGRDGWLVRRFTMNESVTTKPALDADDFYLSGDVDGLYRADPVDDPGVWRNVILFDEPTFSDSAFLLAGGPSHADGTTLGAETVTVPAGTFEALTIEHGFSSTGPYATEDIFETRREDYADGVGLVRARWDYSFDDNDPSGTDIKTGGFAELVEAPGGPTLPLVAAEQEPNDGYGAAYSQALEPFAIVSGAVHMDDPGAVLTDAEVGCWGIECVYPDNNGVKKLEDWYAVDVPEAGQYRLDLVFEFFAGDLQEGNDLDLYVFQDLQDGSIVFGARADDSAGKPEWVVFPYMPVGRYYLAIQAWDTPADPVPYTLSMRKQAVPVAKGGDSGPGRPWLGSSGK